MHHLIVNSLFLGSLTNAIAVDAKLLVSVFAGAIGIAAAVTRNISEIREDRSKRATEEVETARVAALVDVLVKLPQDDSSAACKKELERQLDHCVSKLSAARTKALNRARMSNRDLTFLQRVFVLFPPNSRIAWIIQGLAYLFMAGGPLAVLLLVFFRIGDSGTVSDVVVWRYSAASLFESGPWRNEGGPSSRTTRRASRFSSTRLRWRACFC